MTLETIREVPVGLWFALGGALAFGIVYVFETRRSGLAPGFRQWKGIVCFRVFVRDTSAKTKGCWLRFHDLEVDPNQIEARWDAQA